jgi:hypothetical protein
MSKIEIARANILNQSKSLQDILLLVCQSAKVDFFALAFSKNVFDKS